MYDILAASTSESDYPENIQLTFFRLFQYGLVTEPCKYIVGASLEFVRRHVLAAGITFLTRNFKQSMIYHYLPLST